MSVQQLELKIDKGSTFGMSFKYRDASGNNLLLPGTTFRMHVRERMDSESVLLDLSSENGAFVLAGDTVYLKIRGALTSPISARKGVYDIEMYQAGEPKRILGGPVVFTPEVTRD